MSEVDERIARITQNKGVVGLLIVTYKEDKDSKDEKEEAVPQFVKCTMKHDD